MYRWQQALSMFKKGLDTICNFNFNPKHFSPRSLPYRKSIKVGKAKVCSNCSNEQFLERHNVSLSLTSLFQRKKQINKTQHTLYVHTFLLLLISISPLHNFCISFLYLQAGWYRRRIESGQFSSRSQLHVCQSPTPETPSFPLNQTISSRMVLFTHYPPTSASVLLHSCFPHYQFYPF